MEESREGSNNLLQKIIRNRSATESGGGNKRGERERGGGERPNDRNLGTISPVVGEQIIQN